MELASFWVQKGVTISQEKLGSLVVQVEKNHDSDFFHDFFEC